MSTRKTVLVFGATGHLGAYSALALRRSGYRVIAVGRRDSDGGFFADHDIDYIGGVVLECDGWSHKFDAYKKIDAIVDLAGTMPAHSGLSPMPYVQGIVAAIVNVCEFMRARKIKRIVFNTTPSDVAVYFGGPRPILDDAPRSFPKNGNDHSVYAICKNAAVDILEYYQIKYGFQPCVFRHFMVYGWHSNANYNLDGESRILPWRKMVRLAIAGKRLSVWGNPKIKRDLLYIEDFADAVTLAVGNHAIGMYNIVGDRCYTLEEQVKVIAQVFSPSFSGIEYLPQKPSAPKLQLSGKKIMKDFGWRGKWTWRAACEDMKKYYYRNSFEKLWGKSNPEDVICGN